GSDLPLLDLGCGPGFLVNQLKGKAAAVHGADISPAYVEACRQQHPEATFTCVKAYDNEAYGDIIREHTISRVIMLSVMQYYTDKEAVKALVQTLARAAQHQPLTFLIADLIPPNHAFLDDFKSLLGHALKKGYIFSLARFMAYAVFSDYRKYNKAGILQLEPAFFEALGHELGVQVKIIKGLTPHSGRYNVLFDFNTPS
ncbi:MAG: class I SAM-dependent methyltransferase, partial [Sphingobacteriales bacterium]